jgi:hypothetical protein
MTPISFIPWTNMNHPTSSRPPHFQTTNEPEPMDCSSVNTLKLTKLTEEERNRLRHTGGCFKCRKTGHHFKECRTSGKQVQVVNLKYCEYVEGFGEPTSEALPHFYWL